jgi:hypothetical protein
LGGEKEEHEIKKRTSRLPDAKVPGTEKCSGHHDMKNKCYIAINAICFYLRGHAMAWTVEFTGKAQKQYARLPEKIRLIVAALTAELETEGPSQLE